MKSYSFLDNVLVVNGVPLQDWAKGDDTIQGARREDPFSDDMGNDGKMLVLKSANKSGEIVVKLQQGSASSAYMGALFAKQEKGDFSAVDVAYFNTKEGTTFGGTKGYIKRPSDIARGAGANDNEWVIVVEDYEIFFGLLPTTTGGLLGVAEAIFN